MQVIHRWWRWFLARFRLDLQVVCEESAGIPGWADYHDYPDAEDPYAWHFVTHKCRRCGKEFWI